MALKSQADLFFLVAPLLPPFQHRLHYTRIRVRAPLRSSSACCDGWIFACLHTARKTARLAVSRPLPSFMINSSFYSPKRGAVPGKEKPFPRISIDRAFGRLTWKKPNNSSMKEMFCRLHLSFGAVLRNNHHKCQENQ